jgi:hypothetical protein
LKNRVLQHNFNKICRTEVFEVEKKEKAGEESCLFRELIMQALIRRREIPCVLFP